MKQTEAIIERIRRINDDFQQFELSVDESLKRIKPGQSLLARLSEKWDPYLREHWWPVGIIDNRVVIERPGPDRYEPGHVVDLLGPIGQPFRFRRTLRNVLLMAYDTPPTPLLMTIPWLLGNQISVTLVLLGEAKRYNAQHIPPEVEVVLGQDGLNWDDQVMTLGWADQIFTTVGQIDELGRFSQIMAMLHEWRADVSKNYVFGVFQSILPCGVGACHACMLKMQQGTQLTCSDGPAFDLTQVRLP